MFGHKLTPIKNKPTVEEKDITLSTLKIIDDIGPSVWLEIHLQCRKIWPTRRTLTVPVRRERFIKCTKQQIAMKEALEYVRHEL